MVQVVFWVPAVSAFSFSFGTLKAKKALTEKITGFISYVKRTVYSYSFCATLLRDKTFIIYLRGET